MIFMLPDLPYAKDSLSPYISAKTFDFHHGKHHQLYIDNTNKLVTGSDLDGKNLPTIITTTAGDPARIGIFNNAAQTWNHSFYWQCMKPGGGGAPGGNIAERITQTFGSYENFAQAFKDAGMTQFGSGWAWLVEKNDTLEIMKTPNADTPMAHGATALLTADVWEHAYYIDYQNRRADYLQVFLDKLVDWDFVNKQLVKK
ncbi:MAG: superoxide dismutase [Desulfovibrionales bacterium]|nr:superoxide dismutase [Desulfovibrionales bacterium]